MSKTNDYGAVQSADYGMICLTTPAMPTNYGSEGEIHYTAEGVGAWEGDPVRVKIRWVPTEQGLARLNEHEDDSEICDWCKPVEIKDI
jgi:hypothetical protein